MRGFSHIGARFVRRRRGCGHVGVWGVSGDTGNRAASQLAVTGGVTDAARRRCGRRHTDEFRVNLKLPDQAGAQAFAQSVSTPGNSTYGAYLTPARLAMDCSSVLRTPRRPMRDLRGTDVAATVVQTRGGAQGSPRRRARGRPAWDVQATEGPEGDDGGGAGERRGATIRSRPTAGRAAVQRAVHRRA